ncbi:MAG: SusC/RagA family TonB-linked outer membrane protein [Ginsengibacter sp.]
MKQKSKLLLLFLPLFFCISFIYAQEREVSGKVADQKGNPIANVSYQIKGTTTGGLTSENGTFSVRVSSPANVLSFSLVSYKPVEVIVGKRTFIEVVMLEEAGNLQEVVITALGIKKDDKKLGYAVTNVKGDELARTNTVNPISALQGKVAGVNINVMNANGVQSSPSIQIRGAKVLGNQPGQANNQPIFVVDGNVLTNNQSDADNTDAGSQLKNLNPDDYESITVLKGAAATAIYGSRGLNGAIVITTKKGKRGAGLGIEISSTYQTQDIYKSPLDFQNVYGQGSIRTREGNFAPDGTQVATAGSWGPKMDGSLHPAIWKPDSLVPYSPQPDNWRTFYQNGSYLNNHIALSGASEKFNYRLSYSNNHTKGMLPNNELKRNSLDLNVGGELNKVFSTEFGASYSNTVAQNFYSQGRYYFGGGQNLGFNTYYLPRNIDSKDWYRKYRNPDNSINFLGGNFDNAINGFARIDKNNFYRNENSLLSYLQLKAQVAPWLDLSAKGNINVYKIYNEEKNYGNGLNNIGGYYGTGGELNTGYNLLFMAHATKKVMKDDLGIDLRIINEIFGNRQSEYYGANTNGGLSVPNEFFLGNSVLNYQNNVRYGVSKPSLLTYGLGAILNLNYKEWLNVELTGRNDWISTLAYPASVPGDNNIAVFYPSINVSYSFYDHLKTTMPSWLSSGRLRASLAYVGNAGVAGAYATGSGYSPGTVINQNGQSLGVANQINADIKPNLSLKPQRAKSWEFGTNFGLVNELINVDFAWYRTNTFDQLLNLPGVLETGFSKLFINAGNIQNTGYEFLINVNPVKQKDWNLNLSINGGVNHSKIISFGSGIKEWELSGGYDGANVYAYEGGAFGVLTSETWASTKIDPKSGLPLIQVGSRVANPNPAVKYDFQDYNLVGVDYTDEVRRVNLGKVEPDFIGGASASLRYKNFSFYTQVDGRFGGLVYSEAVSYAMGQGNLKQTLQFRDKEHGGEPRKDSYNGETRYDGVIPNAIFDQGQKGTTPGNTNVDISGMTFREAYDKGYVESWKASYYYNHWYGWGTNLNNNNSVSTNSWIMLREITLGYRLPSNIVNKIGVQGARISLSARNIGYLYNTLSHGQNPESLQSNDPYRPYITGGVPFSRSYSATLNISL